MKSYFVSYRWYSQTGNGFGSTVVEVSSEIKNKTHIEELIRATKPAASREVNDRVTILVPLFFYILEDASTTPNAG